MLTRVGLAMALLLTVPLWSQVDTNGTEANSNPQDQARMLTPPPVNGEAYATVPAAETRSNYLNAGLGFSTAYSDNVLGGITANPVSDVSYSIWPTLALDETTPRLHSVLTYSPGFTFYQRTSARNEADQNVGIDVRYRLSPHVTVSVRDSFQKSSNVFNQPDLLSAGAVYGSPQPSTAAVIPPVADRLTNTANAELTYQFSATGMIGAGGTFTNLHFPDPTEVPGLFDSASRGGSAFYSHRLSRKHYVGALYQYSRILAYPVGATNETQTHAILAFYTIYLKPNLTLSLSGGPQHYETAQVPASSRSWTPAATASLGWQGRHTTFATSYSRIVTGGGGLIGAFHSNTANASARWQIARTWNIGAAGNYAIYKTLSPFFFLASPGGHTVSGTVSMQHQIREHFNAELGYTRLHQSFNGIPLISANPDTNREYISISYQFTRPLGR